LIREICNLKLKLDLTEKELKVEQRNAVKLENGISIKKKAVASCKSQTVKPFFYGSNETKNELCKLKKDKKQDPNQNVQTLF
jgi:hypothetical protein